MRYLESNSDKVEWRYQGLKGARGRLGGVVFSGVSVLQVERVLEMDDGEGCTTI